MNSLHIASHTTQNSIAEALWDYKCNAFPWMAARTAQKTWYKPYMQIKKSVDSRDLYHKLPAPKLLGETT